jgi:hypothetical protein
MYRRSISENNRICRRLDNLFNARKQTKLQDTEDNLENWSEQNGFRFSQTKTVMIHFCRLRPRLNPHVDLKLFLKGYDIKLVESHKILGLVFDKTLDWLVHINYVNARPS